MNDSPDQEMVGPGKSLPFGLSETFLVLALKVLSKPSRMVTPV